MNEISTKLMEYKSPHTRSNDYLVKDYDGFHPKNILTVTQNSVPENTVVVTDVGQHQIWTAKFWKFSPSYEICNICNLVLWVLGWAQLFWCKAWKSRFSCSAYNRRWLI